MEWHLKIFIGHPSLRTSSCICHYKKCLSSQIVMNHFSLFDGNCLLLPIILLLWTRWHARESASCSKCIYLLVLSSVANQTVSWPVDLWYIWFQLWALCPSDYKNTGKFLSSSLEASLLNLLKLRVNTPYTSLIIYSYDLCSLYLTIV